MRVPTRPFESTTTAGELFGVTDGFAASDARGVGDAAAGGVGDDDDDGEEHGEEEEKVPRSLTMRETKPLVLGEGGSERTGERDRRRAGDESGAAPPIGHRGLLLLGNSNASAASTSHAATAAAVAAVDPCDSDDGVGAKSKKRAVPPKLL